MWVPLMVVAVAVAAMAVQAARLELTMRKRVAVDECSCPHLIGFPGVDHQRPCRFRRC